MLLNYFFWMFMSGGMIMKISCLKSSWNYSICVFFYVYGHIMYMSFENKISIWWIFFQIKMFEISRHLIFAEFSYGNIINCKANYKQPKNSNMMHSTVMPKYSDMMHSHGIWLLVQPLRLHKSPASVLSSIENLCKYFV